MKTIDNNVLRQKTIFGRKLEKYDRDWELVCYKVGGKGYSEDFNCITFELWLDGRLASFWGNLILENEEVVFRWGDNTLVFGLIGLDIRMDSGVAEWLRESHPEFLDGYPPSDSNTPDLMRRDFEYYLKNQDELVKKYNGRVVVIKDCQVIGDYDSELKAVIETSKVHEMGTFMVQKCSPGPDDYTVTFHSRVDFSKYDLFQ